MKKLFAHLRSGRTTARVLSLNRSATVLKASRSVCQVAAAGLRHSRAPVQGFKARIFRGILSLVVLCVVCSWAEAGFLGANINADGHLMRGDYTFADSLFSRPLFNQPGVNPTAFWDDMVEQYDAAQLDFVAIWLKGNKQHAGLPAQFAGLVAAINKRGVADRVKVFPFDDNPASWTAQWNLDNGRGYGYAQPFDLANTNLWVYIWDNNFKVFFENVPDANRFKYNGRPVISFWSLAPLFVANANGNASKMLQYFRAQCQATFGFNPYITVPIEWIQHDPTSNNPNIIDAVRPWFVPVVGSPHYASWNTYTWNGVTLGCVVPGYHGGSPNDFSLWIDPNHGATLNTGLQNTVGASLFTFVEGIDDMWEAATCWRARNLDSNGNPLTYQQMGYQDYPNQRLNILRKHSSRPFPNDLKMEAEACDTFGGAVGGGHANNYYRNGPISIYPCADTFGGYHVGNIQPGQWMEWREVPLQGSFRINVRVATQNATSQLRFVIDGVSYPAVTLPNTGGLGNWQTVDAGDYTFPNNSYHTVRLACETGGFNVNFWQRSAGAVTPTPPPTPAGLAATPGNSQVSLSWLAASGATGYNLKRSTSSNGTYTTLAANLSGLNYTDIAVTNSVTYFYRVSATNSFGESTNSAAVSATPSLTASLVAWYKADAITGVSSGTALATWSNAVGNADHASQSTAGWRPAYVTNAMKGLPVVRFNAANSNHLAFNRVVQDDFTILCVFQSAQGLNAGTNFFSGAGLVSGEMPGVTGDFGTSMNAQGRLLAGVGNPDSTLVSGAGFNDGKPHVFTFKRTRSTGAIALYVDGALVGSAVAGTQSLASPPRLVLGAQQTMLYFFTGDIAEVKIFNTPLSDAARVAEETALTNKYFGAVPIPQPPPAPIGLSATPGNAQVTLNWQASSGATGYNVKRSTTSGGGFTVIAANVPATNYTDSAVSNGVIYYYVVSATNSVGESPNSTQVSATPAAPASGLVAWFKADAIAGVSDGASLASWNDSSGNGNHATQPTANLRPAYLMNAMNGQPVVRFTSTNSTYLAFNRVVQDDFTIICVFRSGQGISASADFFNGAGLVNGEMPGVTADFGTSLNANGRILAGVGGPDTTLASTTGYNDGQPHMFTFKRTRSSGATALYVDGVLSGSAVGGTQSLTSPTRLVLGAQQTVVYHLTGDIAEVKIYNSPLTDSDRETEENFLGSKYGILATAPVLTATRAGNALQLTWPAAATGYTLWSATNLSAPVWNQVTNATTLSNTNRLVNLPLSNEKCFYRLRQP